MKFHVYIKLQETYNESEGFNLMIKMYGYLTLLSGHVTKIIILFFIHDL